MNQSGGEQASRVQLLSLLDRQIKAMEDVFSCLQAEREALESRDVDELMAIAERKNSTLLAADQVDQQRRGLTGSSQIAGQESQDPEIRERNRKIRQLAESCREINDANGSMIRWQSRRVDNTLRLLRGGRGEAVVYGPKGMPGQKTNAQTLLTSA